MTEVTENPLDKIVRRAGAAAWASFESFENEAHFKFELFHQLALCSVEGVPLADVVPGTPTSRLHVEAKPQNGPYAQKADLLVCDPRQRMEFNYLPIAVIELKHRLSRSELEAELTNAATYRPRPNHLYVISAEPSRIGREAAEAIAVSSSVPATVLSPEWTEPTDTAILAIEVYSSDAINCAVDEAIDNALNLYGASCHKPTHSFYWRNFEYGLGARWTYPCEADFVARVYHGLRVRLPAARLSVEVRPEGLSGRADLVISAPPGTRVAVEVKMNWDQFKPKFGKDRRLKPSEASNVLLKLESLRQRGDTFRSILIVIQGFDAGSQTNRAPAMRVLREANFPLELISYDEDRRNVARVHFGGDKSST